MLKTTYTQKQQGKYINRNSKRLRLNRPKKRVVHERNISIKKESNIINYPESNINHPIITTSSSGRSNALILKSGQKTKREPSNRKY